VFGVSSVVNQEAIRRSAKCAQITITYVKPGFVCGLRVDKETAFTLELKSGRRITA
jgi:hypothetical protein